MDYYKKKDRFIDLYRNTLITLCKNYVTMIDNY